MVLPALALAAGGAALSGYLGNKSANDAIARRQRYLKSIYSPLFAKSAAAGEAALGAKKQALGSIRSGYKKALGTTQQFGQTAETNALDQYHQALGQNTQDLISRGFYDPESLNSFQRGYTGELSRTLAMIAENTARSQAGLYERGGLAVGGAQGDIGNQYLTNFEMEQGVRDRMAGYSSQPYPGASDESQSIGWLFAGLADAFGGNNDLNTAGDTGQQARYGTAADDFLSAHS